MPSEFAKKIISENLSTFFLLPLIYLNKPSFGQGNFIESYVNSSGTILSVDVTSLHLCHKDCHNNPYLLYKNETHEGYSTLLYKLPAKWAMDFQRFKAGKFSQLSPRAKHLIREYSGLMTDYGEERINDARILALDKSPRLRKAWEEDLHTCLSSDQELLDVPPPRAYREIIQL